MILVVGGRFQGKQGFCRERFPERKMIIYDGTIDEAGLFKLIDDNPECVVITDEIGCGIVPVERECRELVEKVGRVQVRLAQKADEVWRVMCKVGMRIK